MAQIEGLRYKQKISGLSWMVPSTWPDWIGKTNPTVGERTNCTSPRSGVTIDLGWIHESPEPKWKP